MSAVRVAIALSTVVLGLACIAMPRGLRRFTGLSADTPRALSEIRAFGGGFVGLGLAPLLWPQPAVYHTLALAYLVTAAVRLVSILADRSYAPSNWASLALEAAFGAALLV